MISLTANTVLLPLIVQTFGPPRMHARLMSVSLLFSNLIGFGLGACAAPLLAGWWPGEPGALGLGLSAMGSVADPAALLCFIVALRNCHRNSLAD